MNLSQSLFKFIKPANGSAFKNEISKLISLTPKNLRYYQEAFTHSAKTTQSNQEINFERLEFLGDAILNAIITCYLYSENPSKNEGQLTKLRSKLVRRSHLNKIGEDLKLIEYLLNYENQNLGINIYGNLLESLIGAIYLDLGYEKCRTFVINTILKNISLQELDQTIASYKSFIHEWCQKHKLKLEYTTIEEENAEDITIFVSIIKLNNVVFVKGRATNKKNAEENASRRAYYTLQKVIEKKSAKYEKSSSDRGR